MKRFTFLVTLLLFSAVVLFGQMTFEKKTRSIPVKGGESRNLTEKAIIWQNDFSNPSQWNTEYDTGNSGDGPWVIGTDGPTGYYSEGMGPIESTTADNGFAMYDSDALGEDGGTQDSKLIYNGTIDCSAYDKVAVMFESYYRKFQGTPYLEVSIDGTNWTQYALHTDLQVNDASPNPTIVIVNISTVAANQATVYLRFRYIGGWDYAWMVDDISVYEAPDYDVALQQVRLNMWPEYINYGYSGFYGQVPLTQLDGNDLPVWFSSIIKNFGSLDVTPQLNVSVLDPSSTEIFNYSEAYTAPLATEEFDTLTTLQEEAFIFDNPQLGTYTFNLNASIIGQTDENLDNNSDSYAMTVTNNIYAHDNDMLTGNWSSCNYSGGCADNDIVGVQYPFYTSTTVNSIDFYISSMTEVGTSYIAKLMSWDDANQIWSEIISSDFYTIEDESQVGTFVSVPFTDAVNITVPNGEFVNILAAVEYYTNNGNNEWRFGIDGTAPTNGWETWMYFANEDKWYYYGGAAVPIIRLNVGIIDNIATQQSSSVSVYPNPSNGIISVGNAENASIEILNIMGQVVKSVKSNYEVKNIDISDLANGTYIIRVVKGTEVYNTKINLSK